MRLCRYNISKEEVRCWRHCFLWSAGVPTFRRRALQKFSRIKGTTNIQYDYQQNFIHRWTSIWPPNNRVATKINGLVAVQYSILCEFFLLFYFNVLCYLHGWMRKIAYMFYFYLFTNYIIQSECGRFLDRYSLSSVHSQPWQDKTSVDNKQGYTHHNAKSPRCWKSEAPAVIPWRYAVKLLFLRTQDVSRQRWATMAIAQFIINERPMRRERTNTSMHRP